MVKSNIKTVRPTENFNKNNRNIGSLNSTYLGFVTSNYDDQKMGRLSVWIPSINKDKTLGTFSVSYLSPFAGATPLSEGAQTSYGFWAIPQVNDEVVVQFIDGDPNKGIWIGCLYQQYMNNMIPGIASSTLEDGTTVAPSKEYNKAGKFASTSMDPLRPKYDDLSTGLTNQGLMADYIRGQTTASARRDNESKVLGLLSPGGSQFVMDDSDSDKFIRLRTSGGTQLLVNDTVGVIYAITKNGNSWVELSDDGIDVYTAKTMSFRSQQDMNFHSDGDINFFSTNNINVMSKFSTKIAVGTELDVVAGGQIAQQSGGKYSITSGGDFIASSGGQIGLDAGGDLALRGCGDVGLTCCGSVKVSGNKVYLNSGIGVTPNSPTTPSSPSTNSLIDRELNVSDGYAEIKTVSIVSRLPTHEPFAGHPTTDTSPAKAAINTNVSTRVNQVDTTQSTSTTSSSTDIETGTQSNTTNQTSSTPSDWWIPVTGIVSSLYNDTSAAVHKSGHPGVDIAAPKNSNILASRAGKVIWASNAYKGSGYYGYGNVVVLDHGDGYDTIYGHMNKVGCSVGDTVFQGQTIGFVGSTGFSTGNHCHFEMRLNGNRMNPASMIPALGKKGSKVTAGKQKL